MENHTNHLAQSLLPMLARLHEAQNALLAMQASTPIEDVLAKIAEAANDVLNGVFCVVQPYDQATDRFVVEQFTPAGAPEAENFGKWNEPRTDGTSRTILREGTVIVQDYDQEVTSPSRSFLRHGSVAKGSFRDILDIKAFVGVRLDVSKEPVGVLVVNYDHPHTFGLQEKEIAQLFAGLAASAIRDARQYAQEIHTTKGLQSIAASLDAILTLSAEVDLKGTLQELVRLANEVLAANVSVLFLYDAETDKFIMDRVVAAGAGTDGYKWREPRAAGGTRIILQTRKPVFWNQEPAPVSFGTGAFAQHFGVKSAACIPLFQGENVFGVLYVNYCTSHIFTLNERDLIHAFATVASIAIRNADLFLTEQVQRDQNARFTDNLQTLLEIARDLTTAIDNPDQVLRTMIQRAAKLLDVTRGTFVRYEHGEGIIEAAYDEQPSVAGPGTRIPLTPLQNKVRTEHQVVIIEDVAADERLTADERTRYQELGARSVMLVPLVARGKAIGHLALSERRGLRAFSSQEQNLVQILAGLAATAIDNARIYGVAEEQLSAVIEVSQNLIREALRVERSLKDFFKFVIEQTLTLIDFNAGWLVQREGNFDRIVATDPQHIGDINRVFAHDDSISGLSISNKKFIYIPDLTNIPEEEYRRVYKAPRESSESAMKSELVVPLMVGERAIGAFNIETDRLNAFQARHIEMLQLLSSQAALAIELAASRETTAALSQFSIEVSKLTEVDKVAGSVLTYALNLIGGRFGQVLLSEGREGLKVHYTTNQPPSDKGMTVAIDASVTGLAVQERKPVIVPDVDRAQYLVADRTSEGLDNLVEKVTAQLRYHRALEKDKTRIKAELALPIQVDGKLLGVLNVETPELDGFTLQQQQDVKKFLQNNLERFATALHADEQETFEDLLKQTQVLAGTNFVQMLKYDSVSETLTIEQTSGDERIGTPVAVQGSITGRVVRTSDLVYVPDVEKDFDYQRYLGEEMKSELAVPLMVGGDIIGVINVESATPAGFTLEQARRMEALAGPAALAINYARRIESIRDDAIGLQARDIIHRLNNPIGAISFRLETFQSSEWYQDSVARVPELRKFVERTERDIKTTKDIIKEYRQQKGLESTSMFLKPAIDEGLKQADLPDTIKYNLSMSDDAVRVFGNNRLPSVFWNLFDNARKAMSDTGILTVTVDLTADGESVVVRVKDTGHGIPQAIGPQVFEPGVTTAASTHEPARGYGLSFVRDQVNSFGGTIEIESTEPGVGTCFKLVLRLAK